MERDDSGYHRALVQHVGPGARYTYRLGDKTERPDPASRSQPDGVHVASEVVDPRAFAWTDDAWFGLPLPASVIYELHVGTFTPEGTFDAIIPRLPDLKELGITAIEIMPVAQFPGSRNWGYDGVYPYAAQNSYGGVAGLQRLVNACHRVGIAVVLDVVYNHLGPEGNYLGEFGPYFTDRYKTPWGLAINYDGPDSDHVRHYFIENALYWLDECHVDALRLDAIHAIMDFAARPFLAELSDQVQERAEAVNRRLHLIAESDMNDPRIILPSELGGLNLDAQWADDLHHAIHSVLTGERSGYYEDFGRLEHIAAALKQGYVYTGQYAPHRKRRHGAPPRLNEGHQFVVYSQTHDQVGNRKDGDRLSALVSFEDLKLAAATMLLSPYLPMLFMGEEYAETAPFQYFTSHGDQDLIESIRKGRAEEFASFGWVGDVPDPQDEATFLRSKLNWEQRETGRHRALLAFYKALTELRRRLSPPSHLSKEHQDVTIREEAQVITVRRWWEEQQVLIVLSYASADVELVLSLPDGTWKRELDSADERWMGPGSISSDVLQGGSGSRIALRGKSVAVYRRVDRSEDV